MYIISILIIIDTLTISLIIVIPLDHTLLEVLIVCIMFMSDILLAGIILQPNHLIVAITFVVVSLINGLVQISSKWVVAGPIL